MVNDGNSSKPIKCLRCRLVMQDLGCVIDIQEEYEAYESYLLIGLEQCGNIE